MSKIATAVTIGTAALVPIEHASQRVVTLDMIDQVHGRPKGTAGRTFRKHEARLVEGEDFFRRTASEAAELGYIAPNGLILMTEGGYLLLAKPMQDETAWDVQRKLVANYFRARAAETAAPLAAKEHGGITKAVVNRALADHLTPVHAGMDELRAENRAITEKIGQLIQVLGGQVTDPAAAPAREFVPALTVLEARDWPQAGRRGMVVAVSARLERFSQREGYPIRFSAEKGTRLFHVDAVSAWEAAEGRAFLAACRDRAAGQGRLGFDRSRRGSAR
jgi:hypothetical protein